MKRMLLVVCALPLSGCLLEVLTTTAIQGELAAQDAQSATRALEQVESSTARMEAQRAIDAYTAEHGQYPPSLEALVPMYLAEIPRTPSGAPYGYDPQSGTLLETASRASTELSFTDTDRKNLKRLEEAIYAYWESTGRYPRSLDDLDPLYIDKVPKLSSGGAFVYKPKTGAVYHPAELQTGQAPRGGANGGSSGSGVVSAGGGPGAEVATSLAVQQQLNSTNQRGAQYSGNRSRGSIGEIERSYSERQMRALDQLDP